MKNMWDSIHIVDMHILHNAYQVSNTNVSWFIDMNVIREQILLPNEDTWNNVHIVDMQIVYIDAYVYKT